MKQLDDQQLKLIEVRMKQFNVLRSYLGFSEIPGTGLDYIVKYFKQPGLFENAWTDMWLYEPLLWESQQTSMNDLERLRGEYRYRISGMWYNMVQKSEQLRKCGNKEDRKSFEIGLRHERLNRLEQLFEFAGRKIPEDWLEWFENRIDSKSGSINNFFAGSGIPCPVSEAWIEKRNKRQQKWLQKLNNDQIIA